MTRVIITHVGTSLFQSKALLDYFSDSNEIVGNLRDDPTYDDSSDSSSLYNQDIDACKTALIMGLTDCWKPTSAAKYHRQCSPAEIASLSLIGVQPGDCLVLLHSDTPDGRFCSKVLARVLQQNIQPGSGYPFYDTGRTDISVEQVQVDRLWVNNDSSFLQNLLTAPSSGITPRATKDVFVREGCVNYVKEIWQQFTKLRGQSDQFVFNITAGYKGMIPIARDLSLLLSAYSRLHNRPVLCEVCYLHETSSELVRYGAIPIIFEQIPSLERCLERAPYPLGIERTQLPELEGHPEWNPYFDEILDQQNQPTRRVYRSALGEVMHTLYQQIRIRYVTVR